MIRKVVVVDPVYLRRKALLNKTMNRKNCNEFYAKFYAKFIFKILCKALCKALCKVLCKAENVITADLIS